MAHSQNVIETAALGRPFKLGMLYDCRSDAIIPGMTLWDQEQLQQNKDVSPQMNTEFTVTTFDTIEEKSKQLKVDGELKLSLLGGNVSLSGAARYFNDTKRSFLQQRLTLHYRTTTRFEQLTMNHLAEGKMYHHDVFDHDVATHVVTAVLYGADAYFVFDRAVNLSEKTKNIKGEVKLALDKLKNLCSAGAHAEITMSESEKATVKQLNCTFYGDFKLPSNPSTFENAVKVYTELPKMLGENGEHAVPVKVWLYPLVKLVSKAAKLERNITTELIRAVELVIEALNVTEMKCGDLLQDTAATSFSLFHDIVQDFQKFCRAYKRDFMTKLGSLLPEVRGGKAEFSDLNELLEAHDKSPFNSRDLQRWITVKEKKFKQVKALLNQLHELGAEVEENIDKYLLDSNVELVVSYTFLIQHPDLLLTKQKNYLYPSPTKNPSVNTLDPDIQETFWTSNDIMCMKNGVKVFRDLINSNQSQSIVFIVQTVPQTPACLSSCILVYDDKCGKGSRFVPPAKPTCPNIECVTDNSITVKLTAPCDATLKRKLLYKMKQENNWKSQVVDQDTVTIENLKEETDYEIKCEAVGKLGYMVESDVTTCSVLKSQKDLNSTRIESTQKIVGTLQSFLKTLGLENYYPHKLTLRSLLEINSATGSDVEVDSLQALPWAFLRKLQMVNSKSRSLLYALCEKDKEDDLFSEEDNDGSPNFLDLHTALFVCADSFLQQEMALKMSMCQFAVPFVLPQEVNNQCTLMVWALRGIQKEWRPHSMSETKEFVENNVVRANIPLISFVRLSNSSLSKSQVLNQVLNNSEQHHDFFSHREMIGGSAPRVIANGLIEICWNLPCGNSSIDVFPEAVAIANLRGDAATFKTQFHFLTKVSAALFVFLDSVDANEQRLFDSLQESKSKIFLVVNPQRNMSQNVKSSIEAVINTLKLERDHIIKKRQKVNLAAFAKMINSSIKTFLSECHGSFSIDSMRKTAQDLDLAIDETQRKSCVSAEESAENVIRTIGVRQIADYKMAQLPLQGEKWKRLARIEKEQCRLQNSGELSLEKYKVQLQKEKDEIWNKQSQYKMTKTMEIFIDALLSSDDTERTFFLKWLGLKLGTQSCKHLSDLRCKYKEYEQKKDRDTLAKLDKGLLDSSLGIEHYIREMGLIYEAASFGANKISDKISSYPTMAAKMLLAGFPLELLDGDASNIPEKWVSDVLMELHRMVGQKSRLLVLTVLGVQSTGKSTLLNTMFGVQFAVGSGRCTRGAYMSFLPVGEDLKKELLCDFILVIDTEGLKSPALAQMDDSYEHDNELATFVIGLSDVTIINIAMENSTEMKDVLQIAAHAFLRMKEIGKKAVCHFVHQNVAGVSAPENNMTDREKLLEQLNEMTMIAAEMEKKSNIKKFADVLDYDVERNNWYIPGLWHGTPPMAPVNTGYSVAVFDFKKKLMDMLKARKDQEPFHIPDFVQWMSSMWRAVKYENFIFSFRNSLVAHAYDNLCKEYSEWEWSFRRHVHSWIASEIQVQVYNTETSVTDQVIEPLKQKAYKEISLQTNDINEKLNNYYKKKDRYVNLVNKYKTDFVNNIKGLESEMKEEVRKKIDGALEMKSNNKNFEDVHRKQTAIIECQVLELLQKYKHSKYEVSDKELTAEFEKMWKREVANITGLKERDVPADVLKKLHASLASRNVGEELHKVQDLTQYGQKDFQVIDKHVKLGKKVQSFFTQHSAKQDLVIIANDAINSCNKTIQQHAQRKCDYQNTFTKDVLDEIDEQLQQAGSKISTKFELDLKLHICGIASRKFVKMHRKFLNAQDPFKHLQKSKDQYLSDFIDLYRERDQCQRKARDFIQLCLKPAVSEYIEKSLGPDIVDAVLLNNPSEYSSRVLFQYIIQKELLEKSNFDDFKNYILQYNTYVKDWIYNHIVKCLSKDKSLQNLKMKKLDIVMKTILKAMEASKLDDKGSSLPNNAGGTKRLIQNFCKSMSQVISISNNTVEGVLFQNTSCCVPFTKSLYECIDDMKRQLTDEIFTLTDIEETLTNVYVKPQNELFYKVFGCGKKCPFCRTPCEAGGKKHQHHQAAVHRPKGLCGFLNAENNTLCEEICTSSVHGNGTFQSQETEFEVQTTKDYHKYYPDWHIAPDMSTKASDYWKYVLVTFNGKFAEEFEAEPAVYPDEWKKITKEHAFLSLKQNFNNK